MIEVINKYRHVALPALGTRLYVGRPTTLGNPYKRMSEADRANVIVKYEAWLRQRMRTANPVSTEMRRLLTIVKDGRPLQLECSCAPRACHADIIKKVLNEMMEGQHAM